MKGQSFISDMLCALNLAKKVQGRVNQIYIACELLAQLPGVKVEVMLSVCYQWILSGNFNLVLNHGDCPDIKYTVCLDDLVVGLISSSISDSGITAQFDKALGKAWGWHFCVISSSQYKASITFVHFFHMEFEVSACFLFPIAMEDVPYCKMLMSSQKPRYLHAVYDGQMTYFVKREI